jgi:trans-2,3-dihydro-3-hydroxyanthranilate isomerase
VSREPAGSPVRFVLVDVFAEAPYAGNQLAVVLGGDGLGTEAMQRVARELYFSETSFLLSAGPGRDPAAEGYPVRIFTPAEEVPFAGHPVIGTAHVIRTEIAPGTGGTVTLNLKAGRIPVRSGAPEETDVYWMEQLEPAFGPAVPSGEAAAVLGLAADDLDPRFPCQEVSTGLPHVIVPLRNLDALRRAQSIRDRYLEFVRNREAKAILVFCPEPHEAGNDVSTRMFAEAYGITEDPATGSGNGCLAAYLVRHRFFGQSSLSVRSEQGYEIGRPSLLRLNAEERDGRIRVRVGGRAVTVARGELVRRPGDLRS